MMQNKKFKSGIIVSACSLALGLSPQGYAQTIPDARDQTVLTAEGTGNEIDKKRRGPFFTVGISATSQAAKLLVSGEVPNEEYQQYPIRYQFYVNRALFSTQIYSPELAGPIGVDIGTDVAQIPFNYTIVAEVLHPNRRFTSVAQGAVTEDQIVNPSDSEPILSQVDVCELILNAGEENESILTSQAVTINRLDNTVTASFTANSGDDIAADVTLFTSESDETQQNDLERDVEGTLSYIINGESTTVNIEGTFGLDSSTGESPDDYPVDEVDVFETEDGNVELSCSNVETDELSSLVKRITE